MKCYKNVYFVFVVGSHQILKKSVILQKAIKLFS